ncbi:hypothetical protein AJ79_06420 [Helicocarpus griseus UAMH5409]|uniref:Aminoglycoside phosphotransferase domain-containing protein n=1 Tax=Helicocarpus griseus UAMH5409 TaxID=1447875 RepID=A0A2B7XCT1_9EURO|nr:hypothetical protein AJ79_06420 [Helicocarpus griseus UAMH5409]
MPAVEYYEGMLEEYLAGLVVNFDNGSTWIVDDIISEHEVQSYGLPGATAVASCTKLTNPNEGMQGILKVRLGLPWYSEKPECETGAPEEINYLGLNEYAALTYLTRAGCTSTPRLYKTLHSPQPEGFPLPGGSLLSLLMEKLPRVCLNDVFWFKYNLEQRDRVREGFKKAFSEMRTCGYTNHDFGLHNLLWDDDTGKCYIIDMEECRTYKEDGFPVWQDTWYRIWGLEKRCGAPPFR